MARWPLICLVAACFLLSLPATAKDNKHGGKAGGAAAITGAAANTRPAANISAAANTRPAANISAAVIAGTAKEALPTFALDMPHGCDVHGVLFGHPFNGEDARINSYLLTLRQKHKLYARVVINFAALRTEMPGKEFSTDGRVQPRVEVAQRLSNTEKLTSHVYENGGKDYGLHIKFGPRKSRDKNNEHTYDDTTPGAVVIRFKNGDYIVGTFSARQSPRMIWDDESVE